MGYLMLFCANSEKDARKQDSLRSQQMWDDLSKAEQPVREMVVKEGFYLGKYEITQAHWPAVTAESGPFFRTNSVAFSRTHYMRVNDEEARTYAELQYALAEESRERRQDDVEAKTPFIWSVMQRSDVWSKQQGWVPGSSDA